MFDLAKVGRVRPGQRLTGGWSECDRVLWLTGCFG
jgi:hypothetical protein